MNSYYLDILNQLGYHVINPNQLFPRICKNNMNVEIDRLINNEYVIFHDMDVKILFKKKDNLTTLNEINLDNNFVIRFGETKDPNVTYSVTICPSDSNINLEIVIDVYEEAMNSEDSIPGAINVKLRKASSSVVVCEFTINQYTTQGIFTIGSFDNKIDQHFDSHDCNADNYARLIVDTLNKNGKIAKSSIFQKELKTIVPSLCLAINDMLNYCKKNALVSEIVLREMEISKQNSIIKEANEVINSERSAIETLKELRNVYAIEERAKHGK